MKFRNHHMRLNNIRRENADPHHGEADHAAPNFVQQEPIQLHQRNKSWSCALESKYMSAQQHNYYALITAQQHNGVVKNMRIWQTLN